LQKHCRKSKHGTAPLQYDLPAASVYASMHQFEFVVGLVILENLAGLLLSVSRKLQAVDNDLTQAFNDVTEASAVGSAEHPIRSWLPAEDICRGYSSGGAPRNRCEYPTPQ